MPYALLTNTSSIPQTCNLQGEIHIPLFDPPYTVAEIAGASASNWSFNGNTLDVCHITDSVRQGIGVRQFITSCVDIMLTPFTYFVMQYKARALPTFAAIGNRAANKLQTFCTESAVFDAYKDYSFPSPIMNKTYGGAFPFTIYTHPSIGDVITAFDFPGFYRVQGRLNVLQPGTNTVFASGTYDFYGSDFGFPYQLNYVPAWRLMPADNRIVFRGSFLDNFWNISPIHNNWGTPAEDKKPRFVKWNWDCFNNGFVRLYNAVFSDPTDNAIFSPAGAVDVLGSRIFTVPQGFIYYADANSYSTQNGTYLLVSKDYLRYWRLKFVAQSPNANVAINSSTVRKLSMDLFGVTYFAATAPDNPAGIIFNSQGFNFPFLFNTTRLPYVGLPCWPPCYGVPLMKGNAL